MRQKYTKMCLKFTLVLVAFFTVKSYSQCSLSSCLWSTLPPSSGTAFASYGGFSPGCWFQFPMLNGGSYAVSTCSSGYDTQITGYVPSPGTSQIFYNDNNGPLCSGGSASVDNYIPNFTGYARVQVSRNFCAPGGAGGGSFPVLIRQNNNLVFTSPATAMCSGQTRILTATPANVGSTPGGYGNAGNFTGTGVTGIIFVAPVVSVPTTHTITYTFGYVSTTQTILVNPLPNVTANVTSTVICDGSAVTFSGGGASTYTWSHGIVNGSPFTPTLTNGSYSVVGTSSAGCTSTNVASRTVSLIAKPLITASAAPPAVCFGGSTILNGGGGNSYQWSGGITNGASFVPTVTTTYIVVGTLAATGCTNSASQLVTVNSIPVMGSTVTNSVLCYGGSTTLNGNGASTYTWTGGVSNGASFSPTTTITYSVSGTSSAGCTSTLPAVQTITVNPLPVVSSTVSNSSICRGFTTSVNGIGANTYTWTGGITNGTTFTPIATATYSVFGTNTITGCTSTNVAAQTITVIPLPVVTAAVTKSVICIGDTTTLNAGGAATYTWTGGVTNGIAFSPTVTGSYSVTGTATTGCTSTNTAVRSITVNPTPTVVVAVSSSVVCFGNATTLNATGNGNSYVWSGGITNGTSFVPSGTTTYTVTGTFSATGCTVTAVNTITVNPLPTIAAAASPSALCKNEVANVTLSGAINYSVNALSSQPNFTVSPSATTVYNVIGVNANNCANTATLTLSVSECVGITSQRQQASSLLIIPNPNNGEFKLSASNEIDLLIVNELGQIVRSVSLNSSNNNTCDVSELANGLYFVVGKNNGELSTRKIIVNK